MKKTLLSVLAGLAVITSASAMTKEECESLDMVYITNNGGDCIPYFPCKDSAYGAYCRKEFADIQVENSNVAETLAMLYQYGGDSESAKDKGNNYWTIDSRGTSVDNAVGQDYIAFIGADEGNYIQFEFDDTNDSWDADTFYSTLKGLRIATGYNDITGTVDASIEVTHNVNIDLEEEASKYCQEIVIKPLKAVFGNRYRIEYVSSTNDVCEYYLR